jgi:NADPH:quinone reductase
VFGTVTKPYLGDGSFAEYVTVPTAVGLAPLPEGISFADGAALGLAGTAAHGVIEGAALEPGNTVLVIGATGGVGNQVVQLAAAAGARVIATAHTDAERELVTRLGANATVDHTGDLSAQIREIAPDGVDAVAHLAGDPGAVALIRDGGRFVSTLVQSPDQVPTQTASVVPVYANPTREILDELAHAVATGQITVIVQQVFPLQQAHAALAALRPGNPRQTRHHHRLNRRPRPRDTRAGICGPQTRSSERLGSRARAGQAQHSSWRAGPHGLQGWSRPGLPVLAL